MTGGSDGGWQARKHAALAEHGDEEFGPGDLPELVSLLDHGDSDVRAGAVWRIAELAQADPRSAERFVDDVAARVSDPDAWVRRGATWAIQEVADARPVVARSAMDELIDGLDDEDPLVVENAIVGIGSIATEYPQTAARAREELRRVADGTDDPRLRRYAVQAIERIADRLSDEDSGGQVAVRSGAEHLDHSPTSNVIESNSREESNRAVTEQHSTSSTERDDRDHPIRYPRQAPIGGSAPPDSVPEPADASVSIDAVRTENRTGSGPLIDTYRARVEGSSGGSIPIELRTMAGDPRERADAVEIAERLRDVMADWEVVAGHETVLTVLGRGDSPPWIATEVADGREFGAYAAASSFDEALYYASCLVRAVVHAHGSDVIHGGLSPGSVGFVEPIEDAWHVPKVADWGITPVVVEYVDRLPVPPHFAAPEQIAPGAFGRPDQATDVYGLGALLHALFAGRPPFGDEAKAVAKRIRAAEHGESLPPDLPTPAPPSEFDDDVPEEADELVRRALVRDRMSRYETATDLRRDLEALIDHHASWA